jgi:hypothetical protein
MAVILNASTSSGFVQTADTSGEINLQSNGTTRLSVLSTGVSGTLIRGTAVASTSGTSIDFTSIPSWVKRITVMFSDVSLSGTSDYLIQIGDSGGIENTGYSSISITVDSGGGSASIYSASGFSYFNGGASNQQSGLLVMTNLTGNLWVSSHTGYLNSTNNVSGGGTKTLSATLDRIRITTVNGTNAFDGGFVNILYEG